jgi:AcrR family transcriptional regulator
MTTQPVTTKEALLNAAVQLMAQKGVKAATTRAIARAAGVTEGAVYRHFVSKEELYLEAYTRLITKMTQAKQAIVSSTATLREKLREWVRISYEFFDEHPDAFTFVFLTPHDLPQTQRDITTAQSRLLTDVIKQAQMTGQMPAMRLELAASHFIGLMLNVPRLINEGTLEGPASKYVDDVAEAVCRALVVQA